MGKHDRQKYVEVNENYLSPAARAIDKERKTNADVLVRKKQQHEWHERGLCPECGGQINTKDRFAKSVFCIKCGFMLRKY